MITIKERNFGDIVLEKLKIGPKTCKMNYLSFTDKKLKMQWTRQLADTFSARAVPANCMVSCLLEVSTDCEAFYETFTMAGEKESVCWSEMDTLSLLCLMLYNNRKIKITLLH